MLQAVTTTKSLNRHLLQTLKAPEEFITMKSILSYSLLLFAAGITLLASCSSDENRSKTEATNPVAVKVSIPESLNQEAVLVSGQVTSEQTAAISTRIMGYITRIYVKAGDRVKKGQLLVTINSDDIRARRSQTEAMIAEAEAAYKTAAKDFQRFNALYKEQSASAKELESVSFQYASARSKLLAARQMRAEANAALSYTNLRAPFDGTITRKLADEGNMANPGMPILTVEKPGRLEVVAPVAESDISRIKTGQTALLNISATGKTLTGSVREINRSAEISGGQYLIKIGISETAKEGLYSGMYASVSIPVGAAKRGNEGGVWIPLKSIVKSDQLTGVFTVSHDKTALLRWVRLGKVAGDRAEVLSGLGKNEAYIQEAAGKLYNGAQVTIQKY